MGKKSKVNKIYHTGITVKDMDRSLSLYVDLLGCEVISDEECRGEDVDRGLGLKDASFRLVYLKIGEEELELFQYYSGKSSKAIEECDASVDGIRHIAFVVDDLFNCYEMLLENGYEFISAPISNPDGVKWVYMKDPDNYYIEFVELPQ